MTHGQLFPTVRTRALLLALIALLALTALVVIGLSHGVSPGSHDANHDDRRSGVASAWRPRLHLTPDSGWMNDVQRPFFRGGRWHLYNLVNTDYPNGNGTSWQRSESTDLVHWNPRGVAIEKYRNGLGDIETGSVVLDEHDTAGFGRGTVVAIATQQLDGVQRQSLFYSRDDGRTFRSYDGNPVLDNPGSADFRDPKVIRDEAHHQWVMVLAEGHRIGLYTSPDLKHWTYASDVVRDDLGTLECPDLFPMAVDGDPARTTWVLGTSANGSSTGGTTGYAYWTGRWDGRRFTPDLPDPLWLDHGADFYAAVTWSDPRTSSEQQLAERYAVGWMNNWGYARDVPALPSTGGPNTLVRRIRLEALEGRPTLVSAPVGLDQVAGRTVRGRAELVNGASTVVRTDESSYRLRVHLRPPSAGEARVVVTAADGTRMTIGYDARNRQAFVLRDTDAIAARMPGTYRQARTAPVEPLPGGSVDLDVVTDGAATEVYVNGGAASLSDLAFLGPGERTISIETVGGSTDVLTADLTPLDR